MSARGQRPRVFMMDLWATVPYYTAYLSKALHEQSVDLTTGSITYYLDPACFTSRGINVDPGLLDIVGKFRLSRLPRRVLKLLEGIINLSALAVRFLVSVPDIIHVQYLPMLKTRLPLDLWFVHLCRWRGAKVVLTVHDLLPHDTGERYRATFDALYRSADALICHSDAIRARLAAEFSVPEEKISVIPHGPFFYDLPVAGSEEILQNFAIDPGQTMVLWQGIIFPYKGIDLLLRAWQQVEAKVEKVCLVIAGTGAPDLLEEIRGLVLQLGLKRVKMHFRFISSEELVTLYRAADVVVYPYRAITTSGALATGLALGKAIVASDLPVFRELLTDGENALLVAPLDCDALAGALITLSQNAALRERLAGKVRAMNFGDQSWISIAAQTMHAYNSVLSRPD
ncbi:MAG: glycosyltransferase family 4 protein [Acidobacteriaceae bacterium]|nr:glycosyltransferase family 4 protein [Acidobacteriaceae bacterium]